MSRIANRRWQNMVIATLADKKEIPEKKAYLEKMRVYLGLSEEEANAIQAQAIAGNESIAMDASPLQQRQILRDVIRTSLIDGSINREEGQMIQAVAEHIGMTHEELKALIDICRTATSTRHMPK